MSLRPLQNKNKFKKSSKNISYFFYLFPGGQPTPAPKTSAWFLASRELPKDGCYRPDRNLSRKSPTLEGEWVSGRRRKKESVSGGVAGRQDRGLHNNRKPTVPWFIPNPTPLTGPVRPIPPLQTPPPHTHTHPSCHFSSFRPSLKQITQISSWNERKTQARGTCAIQ